MQGDSWQPSIVGKTLKLLFLNVGNTRNRKLFKVGETLKFLPLMTGGLWPIRISGFLKLQECVIGQQDLSKDYSFNLFRPFDVWRVCDLQTSQLMMRT